MPNNKQTKEQMANFINQAKNGEFTDVKPDLTFISYSRIEIPEAVDCRDEVILYGLSY